jgi:uncharacterized membrane protein
MTFGAIALYWLAFRARLGRIQRVNNRVDISYGTYLYSWPVQLALVTLSSTLAGEVSSA